MTIISFVHKYRFLRTLELEIFKYLANGNNLYLYFFSYQFTTLEPSSPLINMGTFFCENKSAYISIRDKSHFSWTLFSQIIRFTSASILPYDKDCVSVKLLIQNGAHIWFSRTQILYHYVTTASGH